MIEKNFADLPEQSVDIEGKPKSTSEFLAGYYQTLGDGTTELLGISTGLEALDRATLGLDGLIVLGGIAGAGKTSLALQLTTGACDVDTPTLFYSLEMPRRAILTKILTRYTHVRYSDILLKGRPYLTDTSSPEKKFFSDREAEQLTAGKAYLEAIADRFYLRTRERGEAEINFTTVEQEINFVKAEHKVERVFVVIDHLQVFNPGEYTDQIDKEGRLITGFKGISERTGAVILLITQKNKAGFSSRGLQTIKGSVDIVYLADVVMTLEGEGEQADDVIASFGQDAPKPVDLVIEKNRYNAPKKILLQFNGAHGEFTERPGQ